MSLEMGKHAKAVIPHGPNDAYATAPLTHLHECFPKLCLLFCIYQPHTYILEKAAYNIMIVSFRPQEA